MKKQILFLSGLNIVLAVVTATLFLGDKSTESRLGSSVVVSEEVEMRLVESQQKENELVRMKRLKRERKERLSASFFLPFPGERNALSDLIDGTMIEKINKNAPVARSYRQLLKEEDPEITDEDLKSKVDTFKEFMSVYLQDMYKIQRGLEEGDLNSKLTVLKNDLSQNLALDSSRLGRLIEIEKSEKSNRQLNVFEKTLVKEDDKLSESQRVELKEILIAKQVTVFDEMKSVDQHFQSSDELLDNVGQCLKPDQVEHFKAFQEYHWHSNDMPEVNDLPGMF
jgi:hypothetical protein